MWGGTPGPLGRGRQEESTNRQGPGRDTAGSSLPGGTFGEGDVPQRDGVLPVLEAQVLGDGVEQGQLLLELQLHAPVHQPQAAGVLAGVAHQHVQVLQPRGVQGHVVGQAVIEASQRAAHIGQLLAQDAHPAR